MRLQPILFAGLALALCGVLVSACEADDSTGAFDCGSACAQIKACYATMDLNQCVPGCEAEARFKSAACLACMSKPCGQEFGCCLVQECGAPSSALGDITCTGGGSGGSGGSGGGGSDCAEFCAKCEFCVQQGGGWSEGACGPTPYTNSKCLTFCASSSWTSEGSGGRLPDGWGSMDCATFDDNI